MPGETLTLSNYGRSLKATDNKIKRAMIKGLRHAAVLSRNRVIVEIATTSPHPPVDTGEMSRVSSWPITPLLEGGKVAGWALDAATKQADFMEFGTKPHWPPFDPIHAWVLRKLRGRKKSTRGKGKKPGRKSGGKGKSGNVSNRQVVSLKKIANAQRKRKSAARNAKKIANAVRFAISKRGIKPRGYYARASVHFSGFVDDGLRRFVDAVQ